MTSKASSDVLEPLQHLLDSGQVNSVFILGKTYEGDRRGVSVHLRRQADGEYFVGYAPTVERAFEIALAKLSPDPDEEFKIGNLV